MKLMSAALAALCALGAACSAVVGDDVRVEPLAPTATTPPVVQHEVSEAPRDRSLDAPPGRVRGTIDRPGVPYACGDLSEVRRPDSGHAVTRAVLGAIPLGSQRASASSTVASALLEASKAPLEELGVRDRVLIQAAALRAAHDEGPDALLAANVVRRMALDAGELRALGSDPRPELEEWIGPAASWVERRGPSCGPLGAHDGAYAGELAFRTVRAEEKRVLFAQIVALDTELAPHVTPYVGLVELRMSMDANAPACVLEATPSGIEALDYHELHTSPFVRPEPDGRVGCGSCHPGRGPHDLADLGREDGAMFRIERRTAIIDRARARGDEIRALLSPRGRPRR